MANIDGIQKISVEELKKRRDIILGMLGEEGGVSKSVNKKIDGVLLTPRMSAEQVSREMIAEAEKKHIEKQRKEWQEEAEKKTIKKSEQKKEIAFRQKKVNSEKAIKKTVPKIKPTIAKKIKSGKNLFSFNFVELKRTLENFALISLAAILALSVIYLSFFFFVVSYRIDNALFRLIGKFLPVPAFVVNNRSIDFYDYVDAKNKLNGNDAAAREELLRSVISKNFSNDYGDNKVIANEIVNSASLNRIRKIKALIDDGGDFSQIAGKYGDRRESFSLGVNEFAKYQYGDKISGLSVGEISDIIFADDGYYLFKCYERNNDSVDLSFIFVQAKNLEKYIEEEAKNIYYVSFID